MNMKQMNVLIDKEMLTLLKRIAAENDISLGELVRKCIKNFLIDKGVADKILGM